jgi:ABC-type multidrug transport system ATPase subunit
VIASSASGKSILMQVLAGRIQDLSVTGDFLIEGCPVDQKDIAIAVASIHQNDIFTGELSAREILRNSAAMKRNKTFEEINADVHFLLNVLGLDKVADNPIGPVFIRGLSGGQKDVYCFSFSSFTG